MQTAKKILVVEDDPTVRMIFESWLQADYDVHTTETGEKALERAAEEKPEMILLDIIMPRIAEKLGFQMGTLV